LQGLPPGQTKGTTILGSNVKKGICRKEGEGRKEGMRRKEMRRKEMRRKEMRRKECEGSNVKEAM
jgi:hypothetical protein